MKPSRFGLPQPPAIFVIQTTILNKILLANNKIYMHHNWSLVQVIIIKEIKESQSEMYAKSSPRIISSKSISSQLSVIKKIPKRQHKIYPYQDFKYQ